MIDATRKIYSWLKLLGGLDLGGCHGLVPTLGPTVTVLKSSNYAMIRELPPGYVLAPKQFGDLQVPLIRPSVPGFLMRHHLSDRMSGEQRFENVDGVALPDNERCAKFGQRSVLGLGALQ